MMKKFSWLLALTLCFAESVVLRSYAQDNAIPNSAASSVDFSKIDCETLLKMDGDERDYTIIFFQGFMSGRRNTMIVDELAFARATDEVIDYCVDNPNDRVISVFEKYRPVR
ncbi:hypothetical protein PCC7424_2053 [Gloeothece citriformis PCC 7424]|uniref:Uncharacterized protein n=1 Tax=Gloeothece citriformis (strain PCC 7424) TaxID=65393 RepID=B7KF25_GLOC7|nr:HdeA family protein [Gloeothece citriformis]ACK70481.1 hypothetical protein PCC7424_2053 [Gloeothece citriformis PCC 7424]